MCQYFLKGQVEQARQTANALQPLFDIVTVKTTEDTSRGPVAFKARNPLPIKTLMGVLGMPGGPLRPPLGKMTKKSLNLLLDQARKVQRDHPEVFEPLAKFFDVRVDERLANERFWQGWAYDGY
jgi:4-hydroxy-tetrahydrodipicolinate synthase